MKHTAEMRVDLDAIKFNIDQIKKAVAPRTSIMAMVKGDAYGHGGGQTAHYLAQLGIRDFGVAHTYEARRIREAGVEGSILVFQPDFWSNLNAYQELDLEFVINTPDDLTVLEGGFTKSCHIMIDTGMGREGMLPQDVMPFLDRFFRTSALKLKGIATHFACADEKDPSHTQKQIAMFEDIVRSLPGKVRDQVVLHAANSGGIINFKDSHYDMIRPGIWMYGLYQGVGDFTQKTAMSVYSRLVLKKTVPKGWKVGYGATYTTPKETLLGVLGLGYADGLLRASSNAGMVWYEGKSYPIRGRISMDQIVIDLGDDCHIPLGAQFKVFGGNPDRDASIAADADRHHTITYERATQLGVRLPKVYQRANTSG